MIEVVWFKRDLRLTDHAPLSCACATGNPIVPLYIFEPDLWMQPESSGRQFDFLGESLHDLDSALSHHGGRLICRVGEAVEVFARLHAQFGIHAIHAHEETGLMWTYTRDKAVRSWARKVGITIIEHRQHGVWRGPTNRNGWAARWDKMMTLPQVTLPATWRFAAIDAGEIPAFHTLYLQPDVCPQRQKGGRREGLTCLQSFLQLRGRNYRKAMSNPSEGAAACSRLSPHLAFGTISMREALGAAQQAQVLHRQNNDVAFAASITSFIARLHWHCHFIQKLEDQPEIEHQDFHPAYSTLRQPGSDHQEKARAWIEGRTGFPFVDACMRSLDATGWLNFRMRAMVMSFSSYHLWQDWRLPAQLLAAQFTDFEAGIHYSQAQMQSGTTGINTARIYNPVKQSFDQDPDGAFIRTWVPELRHVPNAFIHEPWRAPQDLLFAKSPLQSRQHIYPERITDHVAAAAFARTQIYQVRARPDYKSAAAAIQSQHGSRKSGITQVAQRRTKKAVIARDAKQGSFDF